MFKTAVLAAFLAFATMCSAANSKIVCYYGSWANYRPGPGKFEVTDIDPTLCTHIIYTFVGLSADGNVQVLDSWLDLPSGLNGFGKFTKLRELSPSTKAMIAMGGWNEGSIKYSQMASNPAIRSRFVQNVVNFLKTYNFDGFDLDWEYPNQRGGNAADKQNFVNLLSELRQELNKHGFLLSVAVGAAESSASQSYLISQVAQYADFINLMTYDLNGSWNSNTGINAPLYASSRESGNQAKLNANSAARYWISQGAPANKLILGIPAYGRSFTLANPGNNGVGAPTIGAGTAGPYTREAGMIGYNEICSNFGQGGWTVVRDNEQRVPYTFKGNQWIGYDDVQSVREKVNFIKALGLGGAMIWSVETDDFRGNCGQKYPLLRAINDVLRGYIPGPSPSQKPNPSVDPPRPSQPEPSQPEPSPTSVTAVKCKRDGYIRDPHDCNTYYLCQKVNGQFTKYTFHCGAGLVFDPSFNGCNYRDRVPGC
ncbi:Chitotriosidase-1 [Habropoda laboriosa]|uniref:Chitotriosidase-1 n=2 Tax=Habropoda laboriosa TaxID=597456 RepID=A0A0L7QMF8_9HYME|nr:PREDICTED: chitinase-3-like protein 1 isoform X2 [Habropoda laboriosa]XP_017796015.1 PREDICTED: chitinase-3-like protein 1 isoform X2 [Habropoda laboriosa]XP_017796016.1 PREDICTED: chitinase-3-like protein 1 isoform X2 [Habropoda laboriosa]KOC59780.1 Chitotriosidase-1 [Habropoda laboriosa]